MARVFADHMKNGWLRIDNKCIYPFIAFQDLVIVVFYDFIRHFIDFDSKDYDKDD